MIYNKNYNGKSKFTFLSKFLGVKLLLNKFLKAPGKLTLIYLLFTLVIFFVGPIKWMIPSPLKLVTACLVYAFSFYFGYKWAINRKKLNTSKFINFAVDDIVRFEYVKLIPIMIISCSFVILKNSIHILHNYSNFDFSKLFLMNLGELYYNTLHNKVEGRWYIQLLNYLNVFSLFWYPIGITNFKRFPRYLKSLFIITLITDILLIYIKGNMIGFGLYVMMAIPLLIISYYKLKSKHSKKMEGKKTFLSIIILIVSFLTLFNFAQISRNEFNSNNNEMYYDQGLLSEFIKEDQDWTEGPLIKNATFYFTNGYVGMAYALELPAKWTWGIGFSRDFARQVKNIFGFDVSRITYPQRVEDTYGWPNGMFWTNAYGWFASDWTFWGLPILMFIFGWFFAKVWYACINENSLTAYTLFSWLWVGIIFIPLNNQLFQSFEKFMATIVLILIFIFRKNIEHLFYKESKTYE